MHKKRENKTFECDFHEVRINMQKCPILIILYYAEYQKRRIFFADKFGEFGHFRQHEDMN
jgi:hypothetical protein